MMQHVRSCMAAHDEVLMVACCRTTEISARALAHEAEGPQGAGGDIQYVEMDEKPAFPTVHRFHVATP